MFKDYSPAAEPVAWSAAAVAATAAVAYFAHIPAEGTALITTAVVSILAIFTRRSVSPTE